MKMKKKSKRSNKHQIIKTGSLKRDNKICMCYIDTDIYVHIIQIAWTIVQLRCHYYHLVASLLGTFICDGATM